MYKVVIIDDEPIIVEGLVKSIHWEQFSCKVVGTAYTGEMGLKLITAESPDIIFSDIRMPRMDGLTMVSGIKSQFPHAQITILTGFRDFDYAQKAIHLGVNRFLLKPSKMSEIQEALASMVHNLEEYGTLYKEKTNEPHETDTEKNELQGSQKELTEGEQELADKKAGLSVQSQEAKTEQEEILYDSAASSFIVKQAMAYISQNYTQKLRLADVADEVYVSQWHLSKLLNRFLGQSFSEILNGARIERAKELLKDPSLRIGDIAEEVGFLDMAHFSRVFKKIVGISANEYRNKLS